MPIKLERKLKAEANKKGIRDKGAYVYGTMRKLGWKPKTQGGDGQIHPGKPLGDSF